MCNKSDSSRRVVVGRGGRRAESSSSARAEPRPIVWRMVRVCRFSGSVAMRARRSVLTRFVDAAACSRGLSANPNGSPDGLTAVTTADGRFTVLMPHPERMLRNLQMSWTSGDLAAPSAVDADVHNARRALRDPSVYALSESCQFAIDRIEVCDRQMAAHSGVSREGCCWRAWAAAGPPSAASDAAPCLEAGVLWCSISWPRCGLAT